MKITPLDIQQQQFKKKYDRYDAEEVDSFLELVRMELEEKIRENDRLSEEAKQLKQELEEYRRDEKALKEALLSISKFSEDLKDKAKKEAELIISEAELTAERTINQAQFQASNILEEVTELRRQRIQFETSMRRLIDVHSKLLEATLREEDESVRQSGASWTDEVVKESSGSRVRGTSRNANSNSKKG